MAGLAAEGLKYDKVVGQSADLFTLQVELVYSLAITIFKIFLVFTLYPTNLFWISYFNKIW